MSKYLSKTTNPTARTLANFYSTFEQCLENAKSIQYLSDYRLKADPQSSQHVIVESYSKGTIQDKFKIEKTAIEHANTDRLALYHLVATVLNHFQPAKV